MGDPQKKIRYSPRDVLIHPEKYKEEYGRIQNADLSYPIIIYNGNIVDGVHRLTKAKLLKKDKIKAYVFNGTLMKKFLINKNYDWNYVNSLETHDYITLFHKRFS